MTDSVFYYGDQVDVIDGFYKGQSGKVIGTTIVSKPINFFPFVFSSDELKYDIEVSDRIILVSPGNLSLKQSSNV